MTRAIDLDHNRFKEIVKGRVRKDLGRYIKHGELNGRQGKRAVTIPAPDIRLPHFRHGQKGSGGVAQGEGEIGKPIGSGGDPQDGQGEAGSEPGRHSRDVEVTYDELADWMKTELDLPDLEPKGEKNITTIAPGRTQPMVHPASPRNRKRTFKRALVRSLTLGIPINELPQRLIPEGRDFVRNYPKTIVKPQANAAIIFMMDVSGSMTTEQKDLARRVAFFSKVWLMKKFPGTEIRYVIHDAEAKECNEDAFFNTHESGGTKISAGYGVVKNIIKRDFSGDEWNIYAIQFSDGDNWGEDNEECIRLMKEDILPYCNMFGYVQTLSTYGSGDYIKEMRRLGDKSSEIRIAQVTEGGSDEVGKGNLSVVGALRALWGIRKVQKQLL
jgi:uncharacterized sporulation protein YeaH/YhbH (DUF444 family)